MMNFLRRYLDLVCLGLFVMVMGLPAHAAARLSEPVAAAASLDYQASQNPAERRLFNDLRTEAIAEGRVSVAVKLIVPFAPEKLLNEAERARQRHDIASAVTALRARIQGAQKFMALDGLPYVVMDLDAAGLDRLVNVPGLTRLVRADELNWMRDFVELRTQRPRKPAIPTSSDLAAVSPQILGGGYAAPGTHPFQVALLGVSDDEESEYFSVYCGGSLIAERYVVTAAHCSDFIHPFAVEVLVGTQVLDSGGQHVKVRRIFVHPKYGSGTIGHDYDIAVWELAAPVTGIAFAKLAAAAPARVGSPLRLTGWGYLKNSSEVDSDGDSYAPYRLHQIDLPFVATVAGRCQNTAGVTPRMICAGGIAGQGACYGDSGSPLTIDRGSGVPYTELVGIDSSGGHIDCALAGYPDRFTSIANPEINGFIRGVLAEGPKRIGFEIGYAWTYEQGDRVNVPAGGWAARLKSIKDFGKARLKVVRQKGEGIVSVRYQTVGETARPLPMPPPGDAFAGTLAAGPLASGEYDFVPVSGLLTFAEGQTTAWISVPIIDDRVFDEYETFSVMLSDPSPGWSIDMPKAGVFINNNEDW